MLIYWWFIWRNTIALGFWGKKMLTADFNLGLKPQSFVFGGASWGAAGLGPRGEARLECGSAASPLPGGVSAARRVLKFSWARPEGLGPSSCAFRNSRKELPG